MDSLTHLILGHTMGSAAVQTGAGAAAYWGALVGNSLPDIDVPIGYALRRGWAFHRKHTHTVPGIVALSALATAIITLAFPGAPPLTTFGWTLLGAVVHVALDCLNVWGARILWPVSSKPVGFAILFIIDPYILALHGAAAINHAPWAMTAAWAGTALYIALRFAMRKAAARLLPAGARNRLFPVFGQVGRWRYVSETEEAIAWGTASALPGRLSPTERLVKENHPAIALSRSLPQVAAFLARARLPYARVAETSDGHTVTWTDLSAKLRGRSFEISVTLPPEAVR